MSRPASSGKSSVSGSLVGSAFDPQLVGVGRVQTLVVLGGIYMLATLPFFAGLLQGRREHLLQGMFYAAGTAVLLGWVWRGSVWAWRLTVAMCMFAGVLVFVGGMLAGTSWVGWLVSGAGVGFLVLGMGLVAVPGIRAFLDSRWARS